MLKQNTKLNRQGMVYNIISNEERKEIMKLKRQGKTSTQIAKIMNKKKKSIESVKSDVRKSEYKEFKQKMISYVLNNFKYETKYDLMDKKRLKKQIRNFINQILSSNQSSEFILLIPKGRQSSNLRRVKEKIVETITTYLLLRQSRLGNGIPTIQNQNQKDTQIIQENIVTINNKLQFQ